MYVTREDGLAPISVWTHNQMFVSLNYNLVLNYDLAQEKGKIATVTAIAKVGKLLNESF